MAGAGLKLYLDLMSQPSRAVYLFLKSTKIPFVNKPVALRKGEHFTPEFAEINPHQQVPAIDDEGFKLGESVAILKYLSDKYSVPDHWYPKDLQKRARVDSYMAWQHLGLRLYAANVFLTKFLHPIINKAPVDTEKLAFFQSGLETSLDKMEKIYLKGHVSTGGKSGTNGGPLYLCSGDSGNGDISVADLLAICELMQPLAVGHDIFRDRPRLEAWARRVKERVGHETFDEAHKYIYKVRDQFPVESPNMIKF